jgi:predicted transcriptional regulator
MKVLELAQMLKCEIVCGAGGAQREVSGCYIGDLLSLAMSKVQKDNVWITIQSNINITAVAALTEAGCIIICEGFGPDENTSDKADDEEIPILVSDKSAYELAGILTECGI